MKTAWQSANSVKTLKLNIPYNAHDSAAINYRFDNKSTEYTLTNVSEL